MSQLTLRPQRFRIAQSYDELGQVRIDSRFLDVVFDDAFTAFLQRLPREFTFAQRLPAN
jgi:hypothetical protein